MIFQQPCFYIPHITKPLSVPGRCSGGRCKGLVSPVQELEIGKGRMQPLGGFSSLGWDRARDNLSKDKASRAM